MQIQRFSTQRRQHRRLCSVTDSGIRHPVSLGNNVNLSAVGRALSRRHRCRRRRIFRLSRLSRIFNLDTGTKFG